MPFDLVMQTHSAALDARPKCDTRDDVVQYVAVELTFQLLRTSVTVREQARVPEILQVQMIHLSSKISQRPGAQALRWVDSRGHSERG